MSKIKFTQEEVQQMMMQAFVKGENWGVTYSTWFIPTKQECADKAAKDCAEIYKQALINKL